MRISIVIPCYASEKFLYNTICGIVSEMNKLDCSYEIILVNDCSPDNTFGTIKKIVADYKNVVGISLSKNFGQHSALMAGFRYVTGDIIICMDDDGQTPASEIHKLIEAIDNKTDVVYGKYKSKKHAWYRNIGSKVNSIMLRWLLDKPNDLYISSFFAAKRYVIEEIKNYHNPYAYVMGLVLRSTKNIKNIEVEHKERIIGESGYTIKKLMNLWLNGFTAFSVKPLRFANVMGALCAAMGFVFLVYVVIRRIIIGDNGFAGWASLISVQLFIGGMIMFILGIIGEYIGRMYICMNNSPQFVIKEIVASGRKSNLVSEEDRPKYL